MAIIAPFRALRPAAGLVAKVASRPYDVLNRDEAREEAASSPESFLHITRAEIDLPDQVEAYSQPVYDKAKENLDRFMEHAVLIQEAKDYYYIYQLIMPVPGAGERSQTGLVCVSALEDYDRGIIKKHELTRPDKELDRINHIKTTGAQTGNVFLAYPANQEIHQTLEDWKASHLPQYDFVAGDKIRHIFWIVDANDAIRRITSLFESRVPCTYIADGHHRAASAAKVRNDSSFSNGRTSDFFLTTLFPSDQLSILDYNRLVRDMNGLNEQGLVKKLEKDFLVGRVGKIFSPGRLHEFGMYCQGSWYKLVAKEGSYPEDPIGKLDVSILQHNVLDRILSIRDPRTDKRIDFVGGIRGLSELEKRVDSGEMKLAFSLFPVSIGELFEIADSGQVMPPKSTWFEPKLRDGLATHLIT
jgi:uncharacterized protein (DUF1015 family)